MYVAACHLFKLLPCLIRGGIAKTKGLCSFLPATGYAVHQECITVLFYGGRERTGPVSVEP